MKLTATTLTVASLVTIGVGLVLLLVAVMMAAPN
jgi:hypothetical protein